MVPHEHSNAQKNLDDALATPVQSPAAIEQQWPTQWHGLQQEFHWFEAVLNTRLTHYFNDKPLVFSDIPAPQLQPSPSCYYSCLVNEYHLNKIQRLCLILAWVAEFAPEELDVLQSRNKIFDTAYSEFGGALNEVSPGFLPTVKTALFLICGADRGRDLEVRAQLTQANGLFVNQLLVAPSGDIPISHHKLTLSAKAQEFILHGKHLQPTYGSAFPAKLLTTQYHWDDLILPPTIKEQLNEIHLWSQHHNTLRETWQMDKHLPLGYKILFYGPSGTGKTLTAALLGKTFKQPVYRVDLSQIMSKYIGETEQNLERLFQTAEQQQWILFFDEADALFSQRTSVSNANDRHANMKSNYLLQRMETCSNTIILASNLKNNIDTAFTRRFQAMIQFLEPTPAERQILWQRSFSAEANISQLDIQQLAEQYALTGAEINNVVRYASLMAIEHHNNCIAMNDIVEGIRREKLKSGKFV